MRDEVPPPTSNGTVFRLLWKAARRRGAARSQRQNRLLSNRKGSDSNPLGCLGTLGMIFLCVMVHALLGWTLVGSLETAQWVAAESKERLVLPDYARHDLEELRKLERRLADPDTIGQARVQFEADRIMAVKRLAESSDFSRHRFTGRAEEAEREAITAHYEDYGSDGFVLEKEVKIDFSENPSLLPSQFWLFAGFTVLWWTVMMAFQGEGLELDIQRRHHPLWEWLFCHPVRPVAAFSAEMLAPLMANPIYLSAPVFWLVVLQPFHATGFAIIAALLIGLPFAVAASCLNKAIEIAALLRMSPRRRGALLGILSWAGYVAMMLPLFAIQLQSAKASLIRALTALPAHDWIATPTRYLIAGWSDSPRWFEPVSLSYLISGSLFVGAVLIAWWGVGRGLQGHGTESPTRHRGARSGFSSSSSLLIGKNALYRKELLWLWRDKAAVVQVVLIPLTIGAFQAINLRGIATFSGSHWNLYCGLVVICGTYFLLVLGPRSLSSEGGALWIALTWPQGLEDLLAAKARLWWIFSSAVVGLALVVGIFLFPAHWWQILLVAAGWFYFGRALAEKSVTLVTAPSSSGQTEQAPLGRRLAAMLGTFAFGAGVMSQNWHIALLGVVFSSLTAAAMWQNLRARLPHLFDPWSEKLPQAPTLMHAMIAIAILVEVVGLTVAIAIGMGDPGDVWLARAVVYGLGGLVTWIAMSTFLEGRGVGHAEIWNWSGPSRSIPGPVGAGAGAVIGLLLGGFALLYLFVLRELPLTRDYLETLSRFAANHGEGFFWQFMLAVLVAPIAEEYLFRGILYRALDREWGGLRAMIGSAAYFAIYHPPVSWIPVFLLGLFAAALFRWTGRLWPCVVLHAVYNLVVTLAGS